MKKFLIAGCSASAGYGLSEKEKTQSFWPMLLVNSKFKSCDTINTSIVGGDNHEIFNESYANIKTGKFSHAMITWAIIPHTNVNYGFELYRTASAYISFTKNYNKINLVNNQTVTSNDQMKQQFNIRYYNYHWDLADLIVKCNLLIDIAKQYSCQVGFVNYNLPWETEHFFKRVNWRFPSELEKFTQEILLVDSRNDTEIKSLYNVMHDTYEKFGSMQEQHWLNLYNPFIRHQIDFGTNTAHPGPESQAVIFKLLQPSFDQIFK